MCMYMYNYSYKYRYNYMYQYKYQHRYRYRYSFDCSLPSLHASHVACLLPSFLAYCLFTFCQVQSGLLTWWWNSSYINMRQCSNDNSTSHSRNGCNGLSASMTSPSIKMMTALSIKRSKHFIR